MPKLAAMYLLVVYYNTIKNTNNANNKYNTNNSNSNN